MSAGGAGRAADIRPRGGLGGATVALLEGRMGGELADLVRRHQGVPHVVPAVREVSIDAEETVRHLVEGLDAGAVELVVFLTGAGADALFIEAARIGLEGRLEAGLRRVTTVCRGHKPRAALTRRGVPVGLMVPAPYTTGDVIDTLASIDGVEGAGAVALIHYGERNVAIADALRERGCAVIDVSVYEWALPADLGPLEGLVETLVEGRVDAVAFTSQVQVRHLFEIAGRMKRTLKLIHALNSRVVVAAVGPTCAAALRAVGVTPVVVPENPKMGPMVVALALYLGGRVAPAIARRA